MTSPINGAEKGAATPRQRVVAIFNQDAEQKRKRQPAHYVTWLVDRLAGIVEDNDALRSERDALKAENERLRGALKNELEDDCDDHREECDSMMGATCRNHRRNLRIQAALTKQAGG